MTGKLPLILVISGPVPVPKDPGGGDERRRSSLYYTRAL